MVSWLHFRLHVVIALWFLYRVYNIEFRSVFDRGRIGTSINSWSVKSTSRTYWNVHREHTIKYSEYKRDRDALANHCEGAKAWTRKFWWVSGNLSHYVPSSSFIASTPLASSFLLSVPFSLSVVRFTRKMRRWCRSPRGSWERARTKGTYTRTDPVRNVKSGRW